MRLSGWGRYPVIKTNFTSPDSIREVVGEISKNNSIARGNGRSYGDSGIGKKNTICMKKFNKMKESNRSSSKEFCSNLIKRIDKEETQKATKAQDTALQGMRPPGTPKQLSLGIPSSVNDDATTTTTTAEEKTSKEPLTE